MPSRPPTLGFRSREERGRRYDAERRQAKPWRGWYNLAAWKHRRAAQLAAEPLCRRHFARGETVRATVANHVIPHRGDWELFISGELESVCEACHNGEVQREERRSGARGSR